MKILFVSLCLLLGASQISGDEKIIGPLQSLIDKYSTWKDKVTNFIVPRPAKPEGVGIDLVYCYWGTWANYRPGVGAFGASDLPLNLCTHILYSFAFVTAEGELTYDPEVVVSGKSSLISDAVALRSANPDLKFHISIGGWTAGSANFSAVANNETIRAKFVQNVYNFVIEKGLQGVDLDWEYPANRGGVETDKAAFVLLLRDLYAVLNPAGFGLTIAVGMSESYITTAYDIPSIMQYVDTVVLMTYDYHGSWETVTGVNAPLYAQTSDTSSAVNVDASVTLWLNNGAIASKLLLGIGAYGKSFTLTSTDNVGTGASVSGAGSAGTYTQEAGTLAYYEICLAQSQATWNVTEVTGSYAYANNGLQWVGYDNVNTMKAKGAYAKSKGLKGVSMWAVDLDDFSGQCSSTKYPILSAAIAGYTG